MDTQNLDKSLTILQSSKDRWARLSVSDKIGYIDKTISLTAFHAEEWVMAASEAKGLNPESPLSGEEWLGGPYAFLTWLQYMKNTLKLLENGKNAIHKVKIKSRQEGQTVARVYPNNLLEKLLLNHYCIDVWMREGVTPDNIEDTVAGYYKQDNPQGEVLLILGAGNVSSIVPLDIFYKLYGEGKVVMIKMNLVEFIEKGV